MKIASLRTTALTGLAATVTAPLSAQPGDMGPIGWHGGWGWGHMLFGSLMMLLLLAAIVVLIALIIRWIGSSPHAPRSAPEQNRALAILEERYARGEIDKEEFEERRRTLRD